MDEIDRVVLLSLGSIVVFALFGLFLLLSLGKRKRGVERKQPSCSMDLPEVQGEGIQTPSLSLAAESIISDALRERLRRDMREYAPLRPQR